MELKVLESLAYTSAEPAVLFNLLGKLKKLQTDIGSSLPHAEGLVLRPVSLLKTARKIKQKYKRLMDTTASYSSLEPTSTLEHWKQQRVGIKAAKLREAAASAPPLASTPATVEPTLRAGTYQYLKCLINMVIPVVKTLLGSLQL